MTTGGKIASQTRRRWLNESQKKKTFSEMKTLNKKDKSSSKSDSDPMLRKKCTRNASEIVELSFCEMRLCKKACII